jgi:hypothetical protein
LKNTKVGERERERRERENSKLKFHNFEKELCHSKKFPPSF